MGRAVSRLRHAGRTTFRSLRHRNFRTFLIGQAISQTGTWLQLIAQTLLVLKLGGTGVSLGLLVAIQFLPVLVLGPWAGVLADRLDHRRTMLVTQSVMMAAAAGLAALVFGGWVTVPLVYLMALIGGLASAFDNTVRRVIITELVEPDELGNAVGLNSMLMTSSRLIGPALAGATIAWLGLGWCFALNALSFVAVLVALVRLDLEPKAPAEESAGPIAQLVEGLRYVRDDDGLRVAMSLMAVVSTLAFNWSVVLPLFAVRTFDGTPNTYTLLTSILSVGSIIGATAVAHRQRASVGLLVRAAAAFGASILLLATVPTLVSSIPVLVLAGGTGIFFLSATSTFVQTHSRPELRGRVISLHTVLFLGSTPIGGPLAGWISQEYGPRAGLLLGAIPTLAVAGWFAFSRPPQRVFTASSHPVSTM